MLTSLSIILVVLYFVPTCIVLLRGIKTPQGPILLNIFLGWTILGWVGALIWAACAPVQLVVPDPGRPSASHGTMQQLGRLAGRVRNALRLAAKP